MTAVRRAFAPYVERLQNKKITTGEKEELEAEMSGISGMLTSPNSVYTFRLVNYGALSSTAGGVLQTYCTCDISSSVEFGSYLKYMFTECRLRSARLTIIPSGVNSNPGGQYPAILVGVDQSRYGYSPVSPQEVADLADSRLTHTLNIACAQPRADHTFTASFNEFKWASVTTPTADIAAGTVAQFSIAATDACAASKIHAYYMTEVVVEFRNRS
jgi:hypothetical protein